MQQVEDYALQFLGQGRKDWDEPHTRAVAHYAVDIAARNGLDTWVMATAAWFHDIGYYGLFEGEESKSHGKVVDAKAQHMINGAQMAREFLEREGVINRFTPEQRERIVHLVSVHDKLDELEAPDEIALMEADTLGAIDLARVTPTFDKEGMEKYIRGLEGKRRPKFRTKEGITHYDRLIADFKVHAASME